MPRSLHALLVGINEYHTDSKVSSLSGCLNDIKVVEDFLNTHYSEMKPSIIKLENEAATRENIIQTFQSHLCNNPSIQVGDSVLFYYSGHGSQANTAVEFEQFEASKKDETLVCYDSRLEGKYDLADKEIAVLISKVKEGVDIVFLVDACHSGSITRSLADDKKLKRPRFSPGREDARPLNSYMLNEDQYYVKTLAETGKIVIPERPHIVLSACGKTQQAWEMEGDRGLFSYTLMEVLADSERKLTYADLFSRARASILAFAENQTPQIGVFQNFKFNQVFLKNETQPGKQSHLIKNVDGKWRLEFGAIHGLPSDKELVSQIQIAIYELENPNELLEIVGIESVKLKESILDFNHSDDEANFKGTIVSMPPSFYVYLNGEQDGIRQFNNYYQNNESAFLQFTEHKVGANYEVKIEEKKLLINHLGTENLVCGTSTENSELLINWLEQIEKWQRISKLENLGTNFSNEAIDLAFFIENAHGKWEALPGSNISLDYKKEAIWYKFSAKNKQDRDLWISLLHLSPEYGINVLFPCSKLPKDSDWVVLDDEHGLEIPDNQKIKTTDVFKLLISTSPFDDYTFQEEALPIGKIIDPKSGGRHKGITKRRKKAEEDWFTKTITVELNSLEGQLTNENQKVGAIQFKGHKNFKAALSFAPINTSTRSIHPCHALKGVFQGSKFDFVNFSPPTRNLSQDQSIIELSEIEDEEALLKEPLELVIDKKMIGDNKLIPVTFDGDFILPVGDMRMDAVGNACLSISKLPDINYKRSRSLKRAVWFTFLKYIGKEEQVFKLRHVAFEKGKVIRSDFDIEAKVAKAEKILLLVHGIIGDTKTIAENVQFAQDEKLYDLILTFDYENLNTKIEEIAEQFDEKLIEIGLGENHSKQLDIVAHSMGGLVSRYLIENIRKGSNSVHQLMMFGTPNGGSAFGSLPEYRDLMVTLLTVALNYGQAFLGTIGPILSGINNALAASQPLTITLAQMNAESKFIKGLEKTKRPKTKYTIIAGDISNYENQADKAFAKLMDKIVVSVGKLAYWGSPNDVAVATRKIQQLKEEFEAKQFKVDCHHLNYFEHEESRKILKGLLR